MRRKRILAAALAAVLAAPLGLAGFGSSVKAENRNHERYYYDQLDADAKGIYDAMYEMYEKEIFKTGTQEYDLVANGHITSDQLAVYEGNQTAIVKMFGAARDAFCSDYPDIFYVDFSSLSINVSEKTVPAASVSENDTVVYGASLGTGRGNNYYTQGFAGQSAVESAVQKHENKINTIVQGAQKQSKSVREQVIYVNNAIIEGTVYTSADGSNEYVRTSYGALVKGESLCEGYARAVKTVLDALGIRSVLVQGSYRAPDGSDNLHMWNYVQVDGSWYGLDATANDGMKGGTDSEKYLLADKAVMEQNHIPDGVMSGSGFRFTYPKLAGDNSDDTEGTDSGTYKTLFQKSGLVVEYRDGTEAEGEVGVFKVSYKGMGYQEAVDKEQVYMLSRFYQYMPGTDEYVSGNWGYSDPKPFAMPQLKEALIVANGNSRYIEFAITKKAPAGPLYGDDLTAEDLKKNWNFQGTEADFIVSTGKLENPKGNFVPSPFAKKITPGNTGYITCGKTYHVRAEFNEQLEKYDGQEAGYKLTVKDGWSAEANSKIENFKWDGDRTIEFDFTTSEMLADNYAGYTIQITGLRGKGSLKAPDSFTYFAKKRIAICSYWPEGIDLTLGAKPVLLEPKDLSYDGWETEDGKKLVDVVDKIKLVATKPVVETGQPAQQAEQMMDQIEDALEQGEEITQSATFDIRLTHCNHNVIRTGNSVRLFVGFPEGFGPEQEGVVYKAYHFRKDENGKLIAEEISCVTTKYGLIITCNAFSPFAIVEMKNETGAPPVSQKLLVTNSVGGDVQIEGADGEKICELTELKESRTISIKAKDGYLIDRIYLSDRGAQKVTNNKSMKFTVKYEDLAGCNNILDVTFTEDKSKPEETQPEKPEKPSKPSKPSNPKPSADKEQGGTQQNNGTSQAGSSGDSGSGQSNNSGNGSGNSAGTAVGGNATGNGSGDKKTAANTETAAAVKAENPANAEKVQEQAGSSVQEQKPAETKKAADTALTLSSAREDEDNGAEQPVSEQETEQQESEVQGETGASAEMDMEGEQQDGDNDAQESTDTDAADRKTGSSSLLWTILISVAGAAVIVGAIAVYARIKRNWSV